MTAVSPGQAARFLLNRYYPSHEAYVQALAEALKREYAAIVRAGFVLQIDCPDLGSGRNNQFQHLTLAEFRKVAAMHVEALNSAVADLPPDRLRMHVCWGNYEGPHHRDVPLRDIIDILLTARPAGLSVEGANPRHAHEWNVFQTVRLPPGKVLIPGVLDTTTNFIEHPELVAQRIVQYARVVGRENVIAGVDCGFATLPAAPPSAGHRVGQARRDGGGCASGRAGVVGVVPSESRRRGCAQRPVATASSRAPGGARGAVR